MLSNRDHTIGPAPPRERVRITAGDDDRRSVTKRRLSAFTLACVAAFMSTVPCGRASATDTSGDSRPASTASAAERSAIKDEKSAIKDERSAIKDERSAARESGGERSGDEKPGDEKPGDEKPGDEKPGSGGGSGGEAPDDQRLGSGEKKGPTGETDRPEPDAGDSAGGPGTLSVAPSDHVEYPEDRPEWIDAENDLQSPTHRWIVRTPPCETREECEDLLALIFLSELRQYGRVLTGSPFADSLSVEDEGLLKSLVARRYDGTLTEGNLPAHESALELQIGPDFQRRVWRHVRNGEVRQRIGAVGIMATGGLVLVVMLGGATAGISRHRASRESAESRNAAV